MNQEAMKKVPEGEAKEAFRRAMRGRMYGREETEDAWAWFHEGWEAMGRRAMAIIGEKP